MFIDRRSLNGTSRENMRRNACLLAMNNRNKFGYKHLAPNGAGKRANGCDSPLVACNLSLKNT